MTERTFFNRLTKLKSKMKWACGARSGDGNIRGKIRTGLHRGLKCCPITAVYYDETGEYLDVVEFSDASKLLGLEYDLWSDIITAADCDAKHLEEFGDKQEIRLRKKLLKTLGFQVNDR